MNVSSLVRRLLSRHWVPLSEAVSDGELLNPGVYVLAYSAHRLTGCSIDLKDIIYVGMSNSAGGVRQRLKQFLKGIEVNNFHSGAMRFFRDHCGGKPFSTLGTRKRFYVAAMTVHCKTRKGSRTASDFRGMGHVACLEYYVRAHIQRRLERQPSLNWQ